MNLLSHNSSSVLAAHRIWQPSTWRDFEAMQQPHWNDVALKAATDVIAGLPPLVSAQEIESLKNQIALAAQGKTFLLQGGDCAERFQDCNEEHISGRLRILLQMSLAIGYGARKLVVRIGRMAGQYAKPRTDLLEYTDDGLVIPSFRGDNINSFLICPAERQPNPDRLVRSYHYAGATLNYIRTLIADGFTDVRRIEDWKIHEIKKSFNWARYERIVQGLMDAFSFLDCMSPGGQQQPSLSTGQSEFYVSHEALVLPYEEAMTRYVSSLGRWYNLGAHYLWIGDRTRNLDSAHVEYCRGIGNPIAIKVGPDSSNHELLELIGRLNPHHEAGKITLITRFGASKGSALLPSLIDAVTKSGHEVTWSVDPMHGNTVRLDDGRKTRSFTKIVEEITESFAVHAKQKTHLSGIHLELTHENVTECLGGSELITEYDLSQRYETWCDPRLSGSQSLELSFIVANLLRGGFV